MTVYTVTKWIDELQKINKLVEQSNTLNDIEDNIYLFFNNLKTNLYSNVQSCSKDISYEQCQYNKTMFYSEVGIIITKILKLYECDMSADFLHFLHQQQKYVKNKFIEHGRKLCKIQKGNGVCSFVTKINYSDANKDLNQIKLSLLQLGINSDMLP